MVIITITRWRKKLSFFLVGLIFVACLGLGVNWLMNPNDNATIAPSDNLKKDVLTQPVKVQGQPNASTEKNAIPVQRQE